MSKTQRLAILTDLHAYQEQEPEVMCSDCHTIPVHNGDTICRACGEENVGWWTELYRDYTDSPVSPETLIQQVIDNG